MEQQWKTESAAHGWGPELENCYSSGPKDPHFFLKFLNQKDKSFHLLGDALPSTSDVFSTCFVSWMMTEFCSELLRYYQKWELSD